MDCCSHRDSTGASANQQQTQEKLSRKKRRRNRHKEQEDRGGQRENLVNGVITGVAMAAGGTPASLGDEGDDGRLSSNAEDRQIEQHGNTPVDEKPHDEPTGTVGGKLEQGKTEEEREEDERSRLEDEQGEQPADGGSGKTEDGEELLRTLENEAMEEHDGMYL